VGDRMGSSPIGRTKKREDFISSLFYYLNNIFT